MKISVVDQFTQKHDKTKSGKMFDILEEIFFTPKGDNDTEVCVC